MIIEEQINRLKTINNCPEAIQLIDQFIERSSKKFSGRKKFDSELLKISNLIVEDFEALVSFIFKKYDISSEAVGLYACLDKRLFHRLHVVARKKMSYSFVLGPDYNTPNWIDVEINSDNYQSIYKMNMTKVIDLLEENVHLFPANTQKYILNKKTERDKFSSLNCIKNDFERQVFANSLGKKPSKSKIEANFRQLSNIQDAETRLLSLFYFHRILRGLEDKVSFDLSEITGKCLINFYKLLISVFRMHRSATGELKTISKIGNEISYDQEFCRSLIFNISSSDCNSDLVFFILNYVREKEELDRVNMIVAFKISNDTASRSVDYALSSEEIQNFLVKEAKRQFFIKNKHLNLKDPFMKEALEGLIY